MSALDKLVKLCLHRITHHLQPPITSWPSLPQDAGRGFLHVIPPRPAVKRGTAMFNLTIQMIILTEILGILAWCTHITRKPVRIALSPSNHTLWADAQAPELTAAHRDVAPARIRVTFSVPPELKALWR